MYTSVNPNTLLVQHILAPNVGHLVTRVCEAVGVEFSGMLSGKDLFEGSVRADS
jgi:hypothetical protein